MVKSLGIQIEDPPWTKLDSIGRNFDGLALDRTGVHIRRARGEDNAIGLNSPNLDTVRRTRRSRKECFQNEHPPGLEVAGDALQARRLRRPARELKECVVGT